MIEDMGNKVLIFKYRRLWKVMTLLLYVNTGVEVPELIVEWTNLTQNPELLGKIDV